MTVYKHHVTIEPYLMLSSHLTPAFVSPSPSKFNSKYHCKRGCQELIDLTMAKATSLPKLVDQIVCTTVKMQLGHKTTFTLVDILNASHSHAF